MTEQILLVEDDPSVRTTISTFLEMEGFAIEAVSNTRDAIQRLSENGYPLVISDIYIDDRTGIDVLMAARKQDPNCSVILMTARGTMETVMAATRNGAFDYLAKPFELDTLLEAVRRAIASREPAEDEAEPEEIPESEMIGSSAGMVEIYKTVSRVAPTDATVLIEGETGTGKEVVASAIHYQGRRRDKLFVAQNCAAMPENLLESELFGHKRGAFTGADQDKKGLFDIADGGTLFLDEIGEMSIGLQAKLLRVLQESEIRPVGATASKKIDVRIIAATNRSLEKEVEKNTFRQDLFYRLRVFPLRLPPLRERRDDIPLLADHFLRKYTAEMNKPVAGVTPDAMAQLSSYSWPGNIRELENEVQRLVIQCDAEGFITPDLLAPMVRKVEGLVGRIAPKKGTLKDMIEEVERWLLTEALRDHNGNKTKTAETLGITREGLHKKLAKFGM